jgi:hypothetical protein
MLVLKHHNIFAQFMNNEIQPNTSDVSRKGQREASSNALPPIFPATNPDRPRFIPDPTLQAVPDDGTAQRVVDELDRQMAAQHQTQSNLETNQAGQTPATTLTPEGSLANPNPNRSRLISDPSLEEIIRQANQAPPTSLSSQEPHLTNPDSPQLMPNPTIQALPQERPFETRRESNPLATPRTENLASQRTITPPNNPQREQSKPQVPPTAK